jgi:hypothetical protein
MRTIPLVAGNVEPSVLADDELESSVVSVAPLLAHP